MTSVEVKQTPEGDGADGEASIFDPPRGGMRGRFAGGAVFTLGSQGLKLFVQIASLVVLSRLLTPASFGVMAMAMPVMLFVAMLQDLGLTQAAVQKPVLTQRQASSLYWASVAAGAAVALLLAIASPVVGWFYKDARVGVFLLANAPLALITSIGAQHRALLMRQMQFRKLMIRDSAGVLAGMIAAVTCAILWRSYWALYANYAAMAVVGTAGAMLATRWRPSKPAIDPELRKMISFGAGVTGFTLTNFFARNMDNILIGRFWGGAALGLYDRGYRILLFPLQQINQPVVQVMIPALSKLAGEPERYREAYLRVVRVIQLITLPGVLLLAICSDWLVPIVLGKQWLGVIPIFRYLALAGFIQPFNMPLGALFVTQARTRQYAQWGAITAVLCTASFVVGLPWGPTGVALAYGVTELILRTPIYWWYAGREGPVRTMDLVRLAFPFAIAAAVTAPVLLAVRAFWSPAPIVGLIVTAPLSYAVFWGVSAAFPTGRKTFLEGRSLIEGGRDRLLKARRPSGAAPAGAARGEG
jgi:PST family polysaccharide transporter